VAPYCSWHDLRQFAFLLTLEYFLNCLKYKGVGPFHCAIGLEMVYRCEGHLHSDLVTKVIEQGIVKVFCIIDGNVAQDAITTDDVLSEKLFDSYRAYICDRLHLNPLCEVLRSHNGEGVISLC
jgi:hypothetical protein